MTDDEKKKLKAEVYAPLDEAEAREIRAIRREIFRGIDERKLTEWHESAKVFAGQVYGIRQAAMLSSIEYGKIYVRFAFLLNGGAMIALLAFIGALYGRADIANVAISFSAKMPLAFGLYSVGLTSAALSAGAGYANFQYVYGSHLHEGHLLRFLQAGNAYADLDQKQEERTFAEMDRKARATAIAGVIFGVISLLAFIWATIRVAGAFAVLGV